MTKPTNARRQELASRAKCEVRSFLSLCSCRPFLGGEHHLLGSLGRQQEGGKPALCAPVTPAHHLGDKTETREGRLGGSAVWHLPLAQGVILESHIGILAWSLLLPLSLPLCVCLSHE